MIVRLTAAGWEIIYQGAHALLAGKLAAKVQGIFAIERWTETLSAIVDHDDLKESFGDNVYLTELGAPKDFTLFKMTARERVAEAKRRIESGHRKHRWIGLLASRHVEALYCKESVSAALDRLVASERERRTTVLRELKASATQLEAAYDLMEWCDRASLLLCQNAIPAMNRRIEIITLLDGRRFELWQRDDGTLGIDPWPASEESFEVGVEVRTVAQLAFKSDRELEQALNKAVVEDRRWRFARS